MVELDGQFDRQRIDRPEVVLALLTGAARPDDDVPGLDLMLADGLGEALKVMICVDDAPGDPCDRERTAIAEGLVRLVAHEKAVGGLALAVRRGGVPTPDRGDRAWRDVFDAACQARNLRNLGVYVATRDGACLVPPVSGS